MINESIKLNQKIFTDDIEQKPTRDGYGSFIEFRKKTINIVILYAVFFIITFLFINIADAASINIKDDATGGDCFLIGVCDWNAKTCALTADLSDSIIIEGNGIALDGANHRIIGNNTGSGITIDYRDNIVVKNLKIKNFAFGIYISNSENNLITNNVISDNSETGIILSNSHGNIITENTISNNQISGLEIWYVVLMSDNKIYRNNFINNGYQIYAISDPGDSFFQLPPIGGNYWSDFDEPIEGCLDLNSNNFCDFSYVFDESGQDSYSWTKQDGWKTSQNQPPTISTINQYKSDGETEISEGGITTESASDNPNNSLVVFKATLNNSDNDKVKFQIELKEFNQSFNEQNLLESDFVSSGSEAVITRYGLIDGKYKWRARAVDDKGIAYNWQEFGIVGNVDFEAKLVPLYTQVESDYPSRDETRSWFREIYAEGRGAIDSDGPGPEEGCGLYIKNCGCVIASAVMLLRFHGITSAVDNQDVTPLNINNWLNTNKGYDSLGNLNWPKVAEYSKFPNTNLARVRYNGRIDLTTTTPETLSDENKSFINNYYFASAYPFIVYNKAFGHFFVADGKLATTYIIKDPAWYNTKKLDEESTNKTNKIRDYNNQFHGFRLYSPTLAGSPVDGISLNLASPAELLITDSQGRKLGKDPIFNISYNGIPGGSYGSEGIGNADSEFPVIIHQTKNIWIPQPETGNYTIQIIGTGEGDYIFQSLIYDSQSEAHSQIFSGSIQPNLVIDYSANFTPSQPENIIVKPADKIMPEAKIYFDPENKELKIEAVDNITLPAPTLTQTDNVFVVKDAAENTLILVFKKLKQEKREIKARLESLQYNDQSKFELPETKLHFEWLMDKHTGEIKELEQKIEVKHQFKIKAKYRWQVDETKIKTTEIEVDNGKQKQLTKQTLPGMVIVKLITKSGVLDFDF